MQRRKPRHSRTSGNRVAATWLAMESYTTEELVSFIEEEAGARAAAVCRDGYLDGKSFLLLSPNDVKENWPVLGDRLKITAILEKFGAQKHVAVQQQRQSPPQAQQHRTGVSGWLMNFEIDDQYSVKTMDFLEGRTDFLSKAVRNEIMDALYHKVLQNTQKPTSKEYTTVSKMLIAKFPRLKDTAYDGDDDDDDDDDDDNKKAAFATWKESLRWKFRNGRRPEKRVNDDEEDAESRPKKKRQRSDKEMILLSDEDHEEQLRLLKTLWKDKHPSRKAIRKAMKETFWNRQKWIKTAKPMISRVIDKYPFLGKAKWLRMEFKWITDEGQDVGMTQWEKQREVIIAYYRTCDSKKLRQMVLAMEDEIALYPDKSEEIKDYHCVEVLVAALAPKASACIQVTYPDDTDLDQIFKDHTDQSAPFIVRLMSNESIQYMILAEGEILFDGEEGMQNLYTLLFAAYYTYDICYPKYLSTPLIFLQHFVFNIAYTRKLPISVQCLHNNLRKLY